MTLTAYKIAPADTGTGSLAAPVQVTLEETPTVQRGDTIGDVTVCTMRSSGARMGCNER